MIVALTILAFSLGGYAATGILVGAAVCQRTEGSTSDKETAAIFAGVGWPITLLMVVSMALLKRIVPLAMRITAPRPKTSLPKATAKEKRP